MAKTSRRKRNKMLAWAAAASVALLVALVMVAAVVILRHREAPPSAVPPGVLPSGPPTSSQPKKPRPAYQDASCPDVQLISIPGTWESSSQDNPFNPTFNPNALLLSVTGPISQQFPGSRVQVYTVPYPAQFRNPMANDNQMSYNDSRAEGTRATVQAITDMNTKCPLTSYVIVGFSQGAVIAGDVASDIGNGRGPVDEDLVLGVTLLADGRREQGVGNMIPPSPPGEGAEITLHEVPVLSGLGLTMTGPRPGGFGALNDRTNEICAEGDLICAAPKEAFSPARLPSTMNTLAGGAGQPVHALYGTPDFWNSDGQPATVWILNWARGVIEKAPHPKHG
ncbi:cutinase [Mycobacterium intermedium]|uniref:Cutinase n=1 Tax=Mycobacterium intermedium TaxID=28445 RepID=A0A1E3S5H9_MYCIE|nr:cutinase family protein [Mycobacterium intermedium]MCV6964595.1 cutinase family protein [Mycobacterium intermedium]ODQ97388.1 cutinase [Mycobacterium intermedium]OPE46851.1 cutinase [Mycobacterium intermedium]ORA96382.1 cutinase [Mycobacterium intermedium]